MERQNNLRKEKLSLKPNHEMRRLVLYWLSRRDYTQQELLQKLKIKGYSFVDGQKVLDELVQEKIVNEARLIEYYIESRRKKGYGPLRITQELQTRGIEKPAIAEQLDIADNAWIVEARKVWH